MAVPEQGELFLPGAGAGHHALQPPAAQFHEALPLQLLFLAQGHAALLLAFLAQRGQTLHPVRVGPGPLGGGGGIGNVFLVHQPIHRAFRPEGDELLGFRGRAAKAGPVQ